MKADIIPFDPQHAGETVNMWRESKERAIGQKEKHSVESHLHFLTGILPEEFTIDLAMAEGKVVGMAAYNETEIGQLYIHVEYQGFGIGQMLLDKAKAMSSGRLSLYTFEVNHNARKFYEKNGFVVIGRGHENEENLPDILYEWKA
ncbi:GNAT family N-acetyltransferase [Rossellomorea vietnamensis]|uniref:GNAT family N-acetyltransferase n=1 Tax=Rossellomorea vietnamensis TaxID=218284 RepID=UPI001E3B20A9|nr:GNAT family N-acetyltransferase [Rossellomorea vietnamensis]MCC5803578.1 GNAT family N-acetyltransferase [Rossellomorea vietnamensis]